MPDPTPPATLPCDERHYARFLRRVLPGPERSRGAWRCDVCGAYFAEDGLPMKPTEDAMPDPTPPRERWRITFEDAPRAQDSPCGRRVAKVLKYAKKMGLKCVRQEPIDPEPTAFYGWRRNRAGDWTTCCTAESESLCKALLGEGGGVVLPRGQHPGVGT